MDYNSARWHIPDVLEPGDVFPEIPCLCEPSDYDKEGFYEYPSRKGWTIDWQSDSGPVRSTDSSSTGAIPPPSETGAFLHAWLFFGMVHEALQIFGVDVELEDCVVRTSPSLAADGTTNFSSRRVLTTFPLRQHFANCLDFGRRVSKEARVTAVADLAKLISLVDWTIRRYMDTLSPTSWRMTQALSLDAIILIMVLGESFINLAKVGLRLLPSDVSALRGFAWAQNPLEQRMLDAGWCISTVKMLHHQLDVTGLFLASRFKPATNGGSQRQMHEKCTIHTCHANYVDNETYRTKHTEECRGCGHMSVDVERLAEAIRKGDIPAVAITVATDTGSRDDKAEVVKLEVVTSSPYSAISHVWAHGLGNARANSLPHCQLIKIERMVRASQRSTPPSSNTSQIRSGEFTTTLWIDTLCIPVAPEHKELRKLSISRLEQTYRTAEQVLVLDKGLMGASRLASRIEKATRLLCSAWMTRLWTYQEAVVSADNPTCDKLNLQFSDGAVTFHSLCVSPYSLCHSEKALNCLLISLPLTGSVSFKFKTLVRALRYRTTSRYSDEAICLTSVLGQGDVSRIVQTDDSEQRMAIFYSHLEQVPAELIFRNIPRLDIDGYRWAARSFLQQATEYVGFDSMLDVSANRGADGLYITAFPVLLSTGPVTRPKSGGLHYLISLDDGGGDDNGNGISDPGAPSIAKKKKKKKQPTWCLDSVHGRTAGTTADEWRTIVKVWADFDELVATLERPAVILNPNRAECHALVSVMREDDGGATKYCRFYGLVRLVKFERLDASLRDRMLANIDDYGWMPAKTVPAPGTFWCVG